MRPFIDFYQENRISPVAQDISDLARHRRRRAALYRHLGIVPSFVAGRQVIELGPGSGHNALHTLGLKPARYVLLDGNPTGLRGCRELLAGHVPPETELDFELALIEDYEEPERFDLVLCEGVIPFQTDPPAFLRRVARLVAPGGVLAITCVDSVSVLPEALRRLAAGCLVAPEMPTAVKLARLKPVFSPHLATLEAMSRSHDDWLLDMIIQPVVGRLLAIPEAIWALEGDFDVYGTSPRFLTDWRWYKAIHGEDQAFNQHAIETYRRSVHNLLDHRFVWDPRGTAENLEMIALCRAIYDAVGPWGGPARGGALDEVDAALDELAALVRLFAPETASGLEDFSTALDRYRRSGAFGSFGRFAPLFGRGQQYVSFIRRAD